MNVIKRLPPELVARIAAGEVVERPASVLKELVENALDAQASRIVAEIESAGIARLRITDDGMGMSPDDLSLAVQPHATSKLADADQLHTLETLGFRGEALPSIASVSHFSIVSRKRPNRLIASDSANSGADESMAWKIDVDGGRPEVPEPRPTSGPFGTTVEARELFYNLPARHKFLKGLAAEASACADTFLRLALTRPDVAFTLRQGRSELIALSATAPLNRATASARKAQAAPAMPLSAYCRRAREALGSNQAEGLIEIDFSDRSNGTRSTGGTVATVATFAVDPVAPVDPVDPPYRLYGLLSPPAVTRPNRSAIYLTVNGRAVKDRTLTSALLESFRHLLPPKRFPIAVLYLELPGSDVDINVHPAKSEVRFRLPSRIYALFYHAVRNACGLDNNDGHATDTSSAPDDARMTATPESETASESPSRFPDSGNRLGIAANRVPQHRFSPSARPPQPASSGGSRPRLSAPRSDLTFPSSGPLFRTSAALATPARLNPLKTSDGSACAEFGLWPRSDPPSATAVAIGDCEPVSEFDLSAFQVQTVKEEAPGPYGAADSKPAAASDYRVIGQAAGSYIVVEDESGVRLIDQHALHERILFERLLAAANSLSRGDSQGLLVPETVELSAAQAALVSSGSETIDLLSHLGFDCESFGARALLVRAVPAIMKKAAPGRLVSELLEALALGDDAPNGGSKALRRWTLREKAAYILSCKAAIKAGERLTYDQMDALIGEFQAVAGPIRAGVLTCPHGRPLALEISWYELERAVGRK